MRAITALNRRKPNPAAAGFFVCALFLFSGCDLFYVGTKSKIVLEVENNSLSLSQFSKILADKIKELDPLSAKDPAVLRTFKNRIATDFIVDALIEKWFQDKKLSISSAELDAEMAKTINAYPSDKEFRDELALQNKSYQDWRKSVETGLKRKALFADLQKQVVDPSVDELGAYYQNNKARFFQNETALLESILLRDENQADVIKQLYKKTSFEALFKEYSLDKSTLAAFKYGWVERTQGADIEPVFLSKGSQLVGPIQFAEGYRLFKVIQRKPSLQKTFDQVKDQVKSDVLSLRETARFSAWLDEQIKRTKILKNHEAIDALMVETRQE